MKKRYTRWMKNHQKKKQESTTSLIDFNTESTAVEGAIPKFRVIYRIFSVFCSVFCVHFLLFFSYRLTSPAVVR